MKIIISKNAMRKITLFSLKMQMYKIENKENFMHKKIIKIGKL
jgi:hypothetical protein